MKASDYQCDFNHKKALKSGQCMAAFEGLLFFATVFRDVIWYNRINYNKGG